MLCVLVETSGPDGSIALCELPSPQKLTKLIAVEKWNGPSHSTFLTAAFQQLLKKTSHSVQEIGLVALGVGPGRFTGIRVGINFAKTMAFACNIPIYPCSSLRILAESQIEQRKPVLVLLNAFKNSLYVAVYQKKDQKVSELISPAVMLPQDLEQFMNQEYICVGDGYEAYKSVWSKEKLKEWDVKKVSFPQAEDLVGVLQKNFINPNRWGGKIYTRFI